MLTDRVHISHGITKLGVEIPSVSFPIISSCNPEAPCFKKCYARKGRFRLPHNKDLLQRNLTVWKESPKRFELELKVAAFHSRFFRYFSCGDIPDESFFEMMVRIAKELPNTQFLAFTKKGYIVNRYIDEHGDLPENLRVVFSAWGNWKQPNPNQFPVAYIRFKHEDSGDIPDTAQQCPMYCGDCVMTGRSCWNLGKGESVCFTEH